MTRVERLGLRSKAEDAYDAIAHRYPQLWEENQVIAHSARVSLQLLERTMANRDRILEVGAGVGRETLPLAAKGKQIVACDPSERSLQILREAADELGLSDRIETRTLHASQVSTLEAEFGKGAFDGCFSSFALSYEPSLLGIADSLAALLKPGAPLLFSVLNRLCLTELALLVPLFLPRRGLGRLLGSVDLPVDRHTVVVRTYSPEEVRRLFGARFHLEAAWAIPAIIPPYYLHRLFAASGHFRRGLEDLDFRLSGRYPFRYLGSHTAYLFRSLS